MTNAALTAMQMLETLPEQLQDEVVERMKEMIVQYLDDQKWRLKFRKHRKSLISTARQARRQVKQGHAKSFDMKKL